MKVKKEIKKVSQQAQKNKEFPYKVIIHKDEGLYFGNPIDNMQLIYLKPSFGEAKKSIIVAEH